MKIKIDEEYAIWYGIDMHLDSTEEHFYFGFGTDEDSARKFYNHLINGQTGDKRTICHLYEMTVKLNPSDPTGQSTISTIAQKPISAHIMGDGNAATEIQDLSDFLNFDRRIHRESHS
jgi:hypothetical protein